MAIEVKMGVFWSFMGRSRRERQWVVVNKGQGLSALKGEAGAVEQVVDGFTR